MLGGLHLEIGYIRKSIVASLQKLRRRTIGRLSGMPRAFGKLSALQRLIERLTITRLTLCRSPRIQVSCTQQRRLGIQNIEPSVSLARRIDSVAHFTDLQT